MHTISMKGGSAMLLALQLAWSAAAGAQDARAEVQVKVCAAPQQAIQALQLQPAKRPRTRMWLFDTPAFALQQQGLLVRLRDDGHRIELTTKAKVPSCAQVDRASLGRHGKCETDLHGSHVQDAVSISRRLKKDAAAALMDGDATQAAARLPGLLAPEQRALLDTHAAASIPGLRRYGPAAVALYDWPGTGAEVEVWTLPGLPPLMEISQKSTAADAPALRQRLEQQITASGLPLCEDQSSRTPARLKALAG